MIVTRSTHANDMLAIERHSGESREPGKAPELRVPSRRGHSVRGSMFRRCALGLAVVIVAGGSASADYRNPTEYSDCRTKNIESVFQGRLTDIDLQVDQCEEQFSTEGRWVSSCGHLGPKQCLPIYKQTCSIENKIKGLYESCLAKLEAHKAREAAEKRRREMEEKRQEEMAEAFRNAGRGAIDPSTLGPDFERVRKFQELPPTVASAIMGNKAPKNGAYALSQQVTEYGTNYLQGLQAHALEKFDQAWAGYNASNPRPTQAQRDARAAVVANTSRADPLPFAGQSAVLGAYSDLLTMVVEGRANGTISEPVANIVSVVATVAAVAAIITEPPQVADPSPRQVPSALYDQLREQRRAALKDARDAVRDAVNQFKSHEHVDKNPNRKSYDRNALPLEVRTELFKKMQVPENLNVQIDHSVEPSEPLRVPIPKSTEERQESQKLLTSTCGEPFNVPEPNSHWRWKGRANGAFGGIAFTHRAINWRASPGSPAVKASMLGRIFLVVSRHRDGLDRATADENTRGLTLRTKLGSTVRNTDAVRVITRSGRTCTLELHGRSGAHEPDDSGIRFRSFLSRKFSTRIELTRHDQGVTWCWLEGMTWSEFGNVFPNQFCVEMRPTRW